MRTSHGGATTFALVLLVMLAATPSCNAGAVFAEDAGEIQLDSARSRVDFTVKVMWFLAVAGQFGRVQGNVTIDGFRNQFRVDARIDADAVSMHNRLYDTWVKSPEFFDVAQYPQIRFDSDPIPQSRLRSGGELSGELTLRGNRQPVRFELQASTCERPAYDCPIEVRGTIRRSAFGMHSRRGTLGDKVGLHFSVYAVVPPPAPPS